MFMKKMIAAPDKKGAKKISKKKVIMTSIATIASLAVIVGTLLPSAQEVVSPNKIADPPAIVFNLDEEAVVGSEDSVAEAKKSNRFADRLRNRLLSLPQSIRVIFVLPLWVLGGTITSLGSVIWGALFSPALGFVVSWLLSIAALVGLFALTVKLLFPNIPFRKIFAKKNIIPLIAVAFFVVALDGILPFYWVGYNAFSSVFKIGVPLAVVALMVYRVKKAQSLLLS